MMHTKTLYSILLSALAILFATPLHAQANDTLDIRMPVYDDMMLAAPEKINPDTFFYHVATWKHADLTEEFALYYDDYVHTLSTEAFEQEVENIKAAARRYRSKALEFETDYLSANLPLDNYSDMDRIAAIQQVLKRAEASGDLIQSLRARQYLIMLSYYTSQFHLFFSGAIKQLEDLEKISATDYPCIHACYYYIGRAYYDFGDYDRAIPILHKALDEGNTVTRNFHDRHRLMACNTLGVYFKNYNQPDSAEYYFRSMLESPDSVKYRPMYDCIAIANLGHLANGRRQYDKALRLFTQAMPVALAQGDISFATGIAIGAGEAYLEKGDLRMTKVTIDSIYALLDRCDPPSPDSRLSAFYPLLSKYYAHTGNKQLAADYLDSTLAVNRRLEEQYSVMLLLRADQEDHQARQEQKEQQIRLREQTIIAVSGIVLLLAGTLGIILYLYRKRQIAYRELVLKNQRWANAQTPDDSETPATESPASEPTSFDCTLMEEIRQRMTTDKIYTRPELTLEYFAKELGVSVVYISTAVNRCEQKHFNAYINEFRVKEAILLLSQQTTANRSIDEIAEAAGFNDRKSFYRVFKKISGLSPTDFKKNIRH